MNIENRMEAARHRYMAAAHAVQSGIAWKITNDKKFATPKDLRVGIDVSKADMEGFVTLLISKGVISELEYVEALAESMERERQRWEQLISAATGSNVTLG